MMSEFSNYKCLKNKKLTEQNIDQRFLLEKVILSDIFKEVSVYITGFTEPPSTVLKQMILQNGGKVQMYFSKSNVTHIVASNLPDFKIKLWKNDVIVKPEWIVHCVSAKSCLPVAKYILYRTEVDIKDMMSRKHSNNCSNTRNTESKPIISHTTSSNFVDEFYGNSRLHHLSTSVSELRHTVSSLQYKYHPNYIPTNLHQSGTVIMHIDIDCFFVSISLKSRPHLKGLPVCVTHAKIGEKPDSYAEISSCSYEARSFGVRNGMFLGKALSLCPNIVTVPYEFDQYHIASKELYSILVRKTPCVEVVSCDEAYIELSQILNQCVNETEIASFVKDIRSEIFSAIGCTVSAGIGKNKLIARMATRVAKPNGQFLCVCDSKVVEFLAEQNVGDLPGIGRSTNQKLSSKGFEVCRDLLSLSKQELSELLGPKTGETIFNFCRGDDTREFIIKYERKSISVEINYGVRVADRKELEIFLGNLCQELEKRMDIEHVKGMSITLKLKQRARGEAAEPLKYMGHGICDNFSKTLNLANATNDATVIHQKVMSLLCSLDVSPADIRGVGIQVNKLQIISEIEIRKASKKVNINENKIYTTFHCPIPEFLGRKDATEIKEIFRTWCLGDEPHQSDVEKVERYFSDIILYGNICLVQELLKYLRKILHTRNNDEWDAVFNSLLNNIQHTIHKEFNGILEIENL